MKKIISVVLVFLFVFGASGMAFAKKNKKKKCADPSEYRWNPKKGKCVEKNSDRHDDDDKSNKDDDDDKSGDDDKKDKDRDD